MQTKKQSHIEAMYWEDILTGEEMKYMGSKNRIAKYILPIILKIENLST